MQLSQIPLSELAKYFSVAAVVVGGLYKLIVFLIERRDRKRKEIKESEALELSQSSELQIFNIEQLQKIVEVKSSELKHYADVIQQLQSELDRCDESERRRQLMLSKKAKLLREIRRCIETIEYTLTKADRLDGVEHFLTRSKEIVDEYEALLEL